jgi:hypothetical protein
MKPVALPFHLVVFSALFLIGLSGCKKEDPGTPQVSDPVITEIGTVSGEAASATIGAGGGELVSADGRVGLTIPAGALSGPVEITVQPVSGEAPLGLGLGYRLLPEGLTFAKPVVLTFSYDQALLADYSEDFLWIVTQSANGSWSALLRSGLDESAGTVSGEISHFSDWALARFIDLKLTPASPTVKLGESVRLQLTGFFRDENSSDDEELVPLRPVTTDGDVLTPLTPIPPVESRTMQFRVKKWNMNGKAAPVSDNNGSLTPEGQGATYKAPAKQPETNPVAVSAELETTNKEGRKSSYELVSNIHVGEVYSITIKIDGKVYTYYQSGADGVNPPDDPNDGNAMCTFDDDGLGIYALLEDVNSCVFGVSKPSAGSHMLDCHNAVGTMLFSNDENGAGYYDAYYVRTPVSGGDCNSVRKCAEDIKVTLVIFEGETGGLVTGTFSGTLYEDKLSYWDSCTSSTPHTIEGTFRLLLGI